MSLRLAATKSNEGATERSEFNAKTPRRQGAKPGRAHCLSRVSRDASAKRGLPNQSASAFKTLPSLQCYLPTSSQATKILARGGFFLSPRRRSRERIEERGNPKRTRLLSPALSSIRWRRGSCFGCGSAALCLCVLALKAFRLVPVWMDE